MSGFSRRPWFAALALLAGACAPPAPGAAAPPDGGFSASGDGGEAELVVSTHDLTLVEGDSGGFELSLRRDPDVSLAVSISSDSAALTASPSAWVFTSRDYFQPLHVTLQSAVDSGTSDRKALVTLAALGATEHVAVTLRDATVDVDVGAATPASDTLTLLRGQIACAPAEVVTRGTVASFGVFTPGGSGWWEAALYTDHAGLPDQRLDGMPQPVPLNDGVNHGRCPPNVEVGSGPLWICVVFSQTTALGAAPASSGQVAPRCDDPFLFVPGNLWPSRLSDIGAGDCHQSPLLNVWISTYHQERP